MQARGFRAGTLILCCALACPPVVARAATFEAVWTAAQKEKPALIETLRELVAIESGSRDIEGLDRIAGVIAERLKALGGAVEVIEPGADAERLADTPEKIGKMVQARFTGSGARRILLIAHMDTVYPRGMAARQPFRVEGARAYGLGIADDRHGIAVILHALAILKATGFRDFGVVTVLINGDEEIGSPGSRGRITRLGAEHDAVLSFEGGGFNADQVRLATSGIGAAILTVRGRASHAGAAPERGVNALHELAHQIMQARDLSQPALGIKLNWTMARAGIVRNMIPPGASAEADVRVQRVADFDGVEAKLRERIRNKLFPDSQVELEFRRGRPPLQATDAARALGAHARAIYAEIGRELAVAADPSGGGTDAAYAALNTAAPVLEGFGLRGFGAHSSDAEYVMLDSIEPRLYLAARMIMDIASGRAPLK